MNLEHIKGKTTNMIFLHEKNENWIGMNSTATELRLLSKINSMLKYSREYDLFGQKILSDYRILSSELFL